MTTASDKSGEDESGAVASTRDGEKPKMRPPIKPREERKRSLKLRVQSVVRWLHIYISMFSLLALLFFALTGITLNHPDWVFGTKETTQEISGILPAKWKSGKNVDWFVVSEFLRAKHGVHGQADDRRIDENEGSLSFKAPGYSADCVIEPDSGKYKMTVVNSGAMAVINDLHRGHDGGPAWRWLVDVSGAMLAIVALTGIGLLLYLKKIRVQALITFAVGTVIILLLMRLATS